MVFQQGKIHYNLIDEKIVYKSKAGYYLSYSNITYFLVFTPWSAGGDTANEQKSVLQCLIFSSTDSVDVDCIQINFNKIDVNSHPFKLDIPNI